MANDILQALNNIEAQIASLTLEGDPPVPPSETLNAIAINIEALRTTLETRSVAETVAQNTNFDDLIAALNALRLICCPPHIYIGGTPTPDIAPSEAGTEFDTPPIPFVTTEQPPGTAPYYSRKCKVANGLHFNIRDYIQILNNNSVDEMAAVSAIVITTVIGAALGELITPIPILDGAAGGVIGFLAALALVIFRYMGELELGEILVALDSHEEQLICALYDSSGSAQAILDYLAVLDTAGVSGPNSAVVAALLTYDTVNYLYFKGEEGIEAALDGYTPPNDCSECEQQDIAIIIGVVVDGTPNIDGVPFTMQTEIVPEEIPHGAIEFTTTVPVNVQTSGHADNVAHPNTTWYPWYHESWLAGVPIDQDANPSPASPSNNYNSNNVDHVYTAVTDPESGDQQITITITVA